MRKYGLFLAAAFLIYMSFLTLEKSDYAVSGNQYKDPVLFVHGFKGTARSFNMMIGRFEERGWGERALTMNVTRTGRLLVREEPFSADRPAFIHLIFENNRASFDDTSRALAAVMQVLKKEYGVERVKIVSHSMGGIVSVKFLQELYNPDLHPMTDQLVTIGSPFDGVSGGRWFIQNQGPAVYDLMHGSPALAKIAANHNRFPSGTNVLNIAGTGDQVTRLQSALSFKALVPEDQYRVEVLYDKNITHSGLHETAIVDEKIGAFFDYK
ncbi:alpha/beta hydrolase [Domibacillus sp. A3M-37]|uniref:alpha/beta hydrolase n=1 Tax=Domibacillus sp. A3M-37 TaxID=2962037 RepID=UPI0020B71149|nr:alpha/beta hydrolase [Domibacillus sp. A3M-37]MCP3761539.1 alpha/beta hydrolase [Domibacillus sp. A3M-37]